MIDPHEPSDSPAPPNAAAGPDVAIPGVVPVPTAPSFADAPPAAPETRSSTVRPSPEVRDRDATEIVTLQRRADEIASEHGRHFDTLALAAAAAAAIAGAARVVDAGRELPRPGPAGFERPLGDAHAANDPAPERATALAAAAVPEGASVDVVDAVAGRTEALLPERAAGAEAGDSRLDAPEALRSGAGRLETETNDFASSPAGEDDVTPPPFEAALDGREPLPDVGGGPAEAGRSHADATAWNGQTSIGTISHVDGDRAEQYAGRGQWTSFSIANDLHGVTPVVGQSVQINGDGTMQATPEQEQLRSQSLDLERGRALT